MKHKQHVGFSSIILAAGYGTRLLENGIHIPKGLIKSGEHTILGRLLHDMAGLPEITDVTIITNAKFYPHYRAWLEKRKYPKNIVLVNDKSTTPENRKGALNDLHMAVSRKALWNSNILVFPSDTLYDFPLSLFIDFIKKDIANIATIFRDVNNPDKIKNRLGCGEVIDTRLIGFEEKPKSPRSTYAAVPFYYFPKSKTKYIQMYKKDSNDMDAPGQIISYLLSRNVLVRAYITKGKTLDVGVPEDLAGAYSF